MDVVLKVLLYGFVGTWREWGKKFFQDVFFFFFQAEDGIRDVERSRGLGDVYKRQVEVEVENKGKEKEKKKNQEKVGKEGIPKRRKVSKNRRLKDNVNTGKQKNEKDKKTAIPTIQRQSLIHI
eukprot:TRINITY_DN16258_c0_g1_i1.p3 TRINITY_DN16258_c0_g1~~TRINITY_DN16258_c0_g1_i1.p3  ORF type:complete len:123 (-),score=42.48 TRINITY_DN16258_c0_g1_i1:186-554(-)